MKPLKDAIIYLTKFARFRIDFEFLAKNIKNQEN